MAFATTEDVAARLGRELTSAEEDSAELSLELAEGLIVAEAGRDEAWAEVLDPVPTYFRALCIEKAIGVLANPRNLAQASESLGAFSHSETFPRSLDAGIFLTDEEAAQVRFVIYGATSASPRMESILDDLGYDLTLDEELPI